MPDTQHRFLRVAAARAGFLEIGPDATADVPDVIAASWVRSRDAGVDAYRGIPQYSEDVDTGSRLVRCAEPVMLGLGEDVGDFPLVIALTDSRARLVRRHDSSHAVARLCDRVEFAPGFSYNEQLVGTNGVGTVLESGRPVSVVGPEHFTEHLGPFACTGAPVIDPITGRIEGVLDITVLSSSWSPLLHTLVKSAAKDISRNLMLDRSQSQQALFEVYLQAERRTMRQAVFAFAASVFVANATAQATFDSADQLAVRDYAAFLISGHGHVTDTMSLPSGRRARIRCTRIVAGAETAGIVVIADVLTDVDTESVRTPTVPIVNKQLPTSAGAGAETKDLTDSIIRKRDPFAEGRADSWVKASAQVRHALATNVPAIVIGESGCGKFSLVTELFHQIQPAGHSLAIDARDIGGVRTEGIEGFINGATGMTLCVVRNIDQISESAVGRMNELCLRLREAVHISLVATLPGTSLDTDLPFHALLKHFETSVHVPPLRMRTEDIGLIAVRLLDDIAPLRNVHLSPEAMRLLKHYSWPQNITQLREALAHALRMRPVGEIQPADLPGYCYTRSPRTLSQIEIVERDAIVDALQKNNGNRVAAANHLGTSRSTLYRKLRSYGINA